MCSSCSPTDYYDDEPVNPFDVLGSDEIAEDFRNDAPWTRKYRTRMKPYN